MTPSWSLRATPTRSGGTTVSHVSSAASKSRARAPGPPSLLAQLVRAHGAGAGREHRRPVEPGLGLGRELLLEARLLHDLAVGAAHGVDGAVLTAVPCGARATRAACTEARHGDERLDVARAGGVRRPQARRWSMNACTAWPRRSEPNTPPRLGAMFFSLLSQPRSRSASALFPATVTASTLTPSRSRLMGLRRHSAKESSSRWRAGGMSIRV